MLQKVEICGVDTAGLPVLTAEESGELMRRLKAGDAAARERFIVGNMRLVLSLVKRFWAKNANADDVFQAGCIGLMGGLVSCVISFTGGFIANLVALGGPSPETVRIALLGGEGPARICVTPPWLLAFAVVFSVLIGLGSGYYPAGKAVRIPALEAIKSD